MNQTNIDVTPNHSESKMAKFINTVRYKKKLIRAGIILVLILSIILAFWILTVQLRNLKAEREELLDKITELIDNPIVVSPIAPEISLDVVYSEIKEIGELAAMEYLFTDAAKFSDSKQIKNWNIPFTEKSFIMKWNGVIKAGVNLDDISIDVQKDEKKIIVHVPAAQILSYEVDNSSVEVLDEKDNIFNNITISDKVTFDAKTEDTMKNAPSKVDFWKKPRRMSKTFFTVFYFPILLLGITILWNSR